MIPLPPQKLMRFQKVVIGGSYSMVLPTIDFETYSPAGFQWDDKIKNYMPLRGASKKGIKVVGVARYTEHPQAEILCLAVDMKDGTGVHLIDVSNHNFYAFKLFEWVKNGGLIQSFNSMFEFLVWNNIGVKKYKFPKLHLEQLRCCAAKARAYSLPPNLEKCGEVLNITNKKDKEGKRLIQKFCVPRKPTKDNPQHRILWIDDVADFQKFNDYCKRDVEAESEIAALVPDLSSDELELWLYDQKINFRGVQLDVEAVDACIAIIEKAYKKYDDELFKITGIEGGVSQINKIRKWLQLQGVETPVLDAETVSQLLKRDDLPENCRRVLKLREIASSAAVKKLYAMKNQVCADDRLRDLFIYHSARTGRAAGTGPQPQNLPNSGPTVAECLDCGKYSIPEDTCINCSSKNIAVQEWNSEAVKDALSVIKTKSVSAVEYYFENPIDTVAACLRGMFIAARGCDLICSDYSAIEAVVLAALAGEEWRLEVFRTHGKIYEMSASKITGVPFEEFEEHQIATGGIRQQDGSIKGGKHHPLRNKVGKVAELASGYQGWTSAWKNFGAAEFFNEKEMKDAILAWRAASPKIVQFWGGENTYGYGLDRFQGLHGAAIKAVLMPGHCYSHRGIEFYMPKDQDVLFCRLLSGRCLTYHRPRIDKVIQYNKEKSQLSFEGWNTNPNNGALGWIRMNTYGGKLTENVVQATARDILAHAIINLEKRGYPVVLHIHDEIVSEVPENTGSLEEFEKIMSTLPAWAKDWPIKAKGGWSGKRYRK